MKSKWDHTKLNDKIYRESVKEMEKMVCEYCGKQVRDIVNHLRKHQLCLEKHNDKIYRESVKEMEK
jgi:hypothetical protein